MGIDPDGEFEIEHRVTLSFLGPMLIDHLE